MFDFIHARCRNEIDYLRVQLKYYQDKCNRLEEQLLKRNSEIVVRMPDVPVIATDNVATAAKEGLLAQIAREGPNQFVKDWFPEPKIATRPKENKINAPE